MIKRIRIARVVIQIHPDAMGVSISTIALQIPLNVLHVIKRFLGAFYVRVVALAFIAKHIFISSIPLTAHAYRVGTSWNIAITARLLLIAFLALTIHIL